MRASLRLNRAGSSRPSLQIDPALRHFEQNVPSLGDINTTSTAMFFEVVIPVWCGKALAFRPY